MLTNLSSSSPIPSSRLALKNLAARRSAVGGGQRRSAPCSQRCVAGDSTPCKVTPFILHGVVFQEDTTPSRMTGVTLHRAVSPECSSSPTPPSRKSPAAMRSALGWGQGVEGSMAKLSTPIKDLRFRVQDLGFRFQRPGFRVQSSGFGVQGSGFRLSGLGFGGQCSVFSVQGSGFRDQDSGFRAQGSEF